MTVVELLSLGVGVVQAPDWISPRNPLTDDSGGIVKSWGWGCAGSQLNLIQKPTYLWQWWNCYVLGLGLCMSPTDSHPETHLPMTVMEGFSLPSSVNMEGISSLAKGLLGLGSLGVPSTLVQKPTVLCQPMMEWRMQLWSWNRGPFFWKITFTGVWCLHWNLWHFNICLLMKIRAP